MEEADVMTQPRRSPRTASFVLVLALLPLALARAVAAETVEQWGTFELSLAGPRDGNPFIDVQLSARFYQDEASVEAAGFYDGDGAYRVRFMPERVGTWRYVTRSNRSELDGLRGEFTATSPSARNHGPVRVANTFHFAYADGTPFKQVGTTCYAWIHQPAALQEQTLETLGEAPFNKLRMCVFPKRYTWNENEPELYPFEGTPPRTWNTERFNPAFFQNLDRRVAELRNLGIEADIILFHPYDKGHWGFDRMTPVEDDRYLKYVVSRLAAFRNVWWSLANEYDFMEKKRPEDWDRFFQMVEASDPYRHLRSIHNGYDIYDHNKPWVTHASIQNGSAVEDSARAVLYRDVYRKPIVFDEVKYEGDIPKRWGNISAEEMVHRFWEGTIAGTYVGHGETYLHESDVLWWSKGGVLRGKSPSRLAFLRKVLEDGPAEGIDPIDKWQNPRYGGRAPDYYIVFFGSDAPTSWEFKLPKRGLENGMKFKLEVIDTWRMTVTPVEETFRVRAIDGYFFADESGRSVPLPGRTAMALRIRRVADDARFKVTVDPGTELPPQTRAAILANIRAAAALWGRHLAGEATIEIVFRLDVNASSGRGSGASVTTSFVSTDADGRNVFEQGAAAELRTGVDPNGDAPDVELVLHPDYLRTLWLDPDPWRRVADVPRDRTDAVSVFLHELGHAFAFVGWIDPETGARPDGHLSSYDVHVEHRDGEFWFAGPNAVRHFGDAVPLTRRPNNYHHVGRAGSTSHRELNKDLMNGVMFDYGTRYEISELDLAIFADAGVALRVPPTPR